KLAALAIEIAEADALLIAESLAPRSIDVVFVDPPFGDAAAFALALDLAPHLYAPGGFLYVETRPPHDSSAHASLAGWQV
ncbi:16S rRNA (guanine(966)-N(2))-methyltransferase RsmD, partial [Burkholderia pseudomallei]